jgi:Tfp pilus assembly protein PilP
MSRICHRGIVLLAWIAVLVPSLRAAQQPKGAKAATPIAKQVAESPMVNVGVRYQSQNRRDPFLNPLALKKAQKPVEDEEEPRGQAPPGIGGMYIAQVTLQGVASQDGDLTAVFRGTDGRAYFLHEGDRLFDGSLTKISADSATLTREKRFRSGKVLREVVTKRLRPL